MTEDDLPASERQKLDAMREQHREILDAMQARMGPVLGEKYADLVSHFGALLGAVDFLKDEHQQEEIIECLDGMRECVQIVAWLELDAILDKAEEDGVEMYSEPARAKMQTELEGDLQSIVRKSTVTLRIPVEDDEEDEDD